MTRIKVFVLEYGIIEIHYNSILKSKPYLVRSFTYDSDPSEIRCEKEDIDYLLSILKTHSDFIEKEI